MGYSRNRFDAAHSLTEATTVADVLSEMDGQMAQVRTVYATTRADSSAVTFAAGSTHRIEAWNGSGALATIDGAEVPKTLLLPAPPSAPGVRRYRVGLDGQRRAIEKVEARLTGRLPTAERTRLTDLLAAKQRIFNTMWVREMMYNRFDADIARWTQHYNAALSPATPLDPNIPKSIFYQESRMGTHGRFLMPPPYGLGAGQNHPVMSRYNIGQAIDSYGPQQWLMMREMAPALASGAGLDALASGNRWHGLGNSEYEQRFGFSRVLLTFFAARSGGRNLMGARDVDLHLDYAFWIRTAIRWLFVKKGTRSWADAVKRYNGSGASAARYRDAVLARVGAADAFRATDQASEDTPTQANADGARLSWVDITRIPNSNGVQQVFYRLDGAPEIGVKPGNESHAIFNLKVENTNSVYNHSNVETRVRLFKIHRGRELEQVYPAPDASPSWNVARQSDLEDESSAIIPIRFPRHILQKAYAPDYPMARIEVEYRWREVNQFGGRYHAARTGLDFVLVAPDEFMFQERKHVTRVDFSKLPATGGDEIKRKFWVPLRSMQFNRYIQGGDQVQLTISSSVTRTASAAASSSSTQGSSQTSGTSTTSGFSSTTSVKQTQEASLKADVKIGELGVKGMMEHGLSMTHSFSRTNSRSRTVSRSLARSITNAQSYATANALTFRSSFTYGPPPAVGTRRTGQDRDISLGVSLAPIVDYYEVPSVHFDKVNQYGQVTRRRESTTLVPYVVKWRTIVHPD
ncbi:hypothetical protein [Tropicibacter naphthalenivorans]|uniref:Uncharacterized protein n=1 Tax=Tropicibacter naphthalenivorans TaxID=441103 RepID=A0A0P1H296_9RHOB|nr:hypothetical protein [Tropicibacter naphthalenivorans]CUH82547.1 hypothetical protein TRN7648_04089 [Tropicibacter naphthalenivorans]SMD09826.1 hypothetical protein SAMN04488093_12013 [Tropicibacter naphthalenivorans]